jgi:hypothetical protein
MQQFINNFGGVIAAALPIGTLTISIPDAQAQRIPATPSPQEPLYLTLFDTATPGKFEIIRLIGLNSGTPGAGPPVIYDCERAVEEYAEQDWPIGATFESRITAALTRELHPDSILTDGANVLIGANGNVLTGV